LGKVKEIHTDLTHYHISMLAKKDPMGLKKRSTGPQLALTFPSSWKKDPFGS